MMTGNNIIYSESNGLTFYNIFSNFHYWAEIFRVKEHSDVGFFSIVNFCCYELANFMTPYNELFL